MAPAPPLPPSHRQAGPSRPVGRAFLPVPLGRSCVPDGVSKPLINSHLDTRCFAPCGASPSFQIPWTFIVPTKGEGGGGSLHFFRPRALATITPLFAAFAKEKHLTNIRINILQFANAIRVLPGTGHLQVGPRSASQKTANNSESNSCTLTKSNPCSYNILSKAPRA